ncbi:MAG TPA: tRNA preQ1(34) S-adenosylmethionine ribosyltransferase-isomerase QueA [Geminicoccaceae bacterium]|nr:tRNA preQ1(34) S-adenosylmethionine ribosyltransferase-isomerase QueA [Geminicoccaceae bacterium]
MKVELFDFELPKELIAQAPARPRDAARLLLVGERLEAFRMLDLPALLRPGDLLVVNDTRVLPTRFEARRDTGRVEVTLHKQLDARRWLAFARPGRACRPGDRLVLAPGLVADVREKTAAGELVLGFEREGADLIEAIKRHGRMPLPPSIRRGPEGAAEDFEDYQTRFAAADGAVAAPTAGLHFTERLLTALSARGVATAAVTLHVGAGTFQPVRVADTADHVMHAEEYVVGEAAAAAIARTKAAGGRLVAVGTTVLRVLESVADPGGRVRPGVGETRLFLTPGHRFRTADLLLTNFHLPRSTLFMLVSAFGGMQRLRDAYAFAIARRFRFYSYGDACLIERNDTG